MDCQLLITFGYDGAGFHGLQPQPGVQTAGGALLARLQAASGEMPYAVSFAARTDAGVSARVNIMSCRLRGTIDPAALAQHVSAPRADGLREVAVQALPFRVMARNSAIAKTYTYAFVGGSTPAGVDRGAGQAARRDDILPAWHVAPPLDPTRMHEAGQALLGTHDFGAFRAASCGAKNPVKTLTGLTLEGPFPALIGQRYHLHVEGSGFLRHMVRIIAGTLAEVGCGLRASESVAAALAARDRQAAGVCAPAHGLTLWQISTESRLTPYLAALAAPPAAPFLLQA